MEKDGRNLCKGKRRHRSIRYFFIKVHANNEEFIIKYCITSAMLANYFTKPLQGLLFIRLRELIMGWTHVETLRNYAPPTKKESVENHVSGDEPKIPQKADYAQIVTGNQIIKTDAS